MEVHTDHVAALAYPRCAQICTEAPPDRVGRVSPVVKGQHPSPPHEVYRARPQANQGFSAVLLQQLRGRSRRRQDSRARRLRIGDGAAPAGTGKVTGAMGGEEGEISLASSFQDLEVKRQTPTAKVGLPLAEIRHRAFVATVALGTVHTARL